jgi:hypothetical protein
MTTRRCERSRTLWPGIADTILPLGLALVALAGCSSGDDAAASTIAPITALTIPTAPGTSPTTPAPTTPVTSPVTSPLASPSTAAPSSPATTPTTTLPDGAALLQQSFDALASGYHFVTQATVNGTPALTAEGDQIAGSTRMTVTSQGKAVDYVVMPDGTWVADNGTWQELDSPAPATDPITALRSPQSVTVAAYAPPQTTLTATYPSSALALPGDQPVDVSFELAGTTLTAISYATPDGTSTVRTDIGAVANTAPITSPSVAG